MKADKALVDYIKDHPPENGSTVKMPGKYVNNAFVDYNAAAEAWEQTRKPVIKRYAEGKTEAELVKEAKDVLRGIRQKDIEYHPFSKRFLSSTDFHTDMVNILILLLGPQLLPLQERYSKEKSPAIEKALGDIYDAIFKKSDRITKKREGADNAKDE